MLLKVLLFYTLFILGATLIVACFSKRKAVFVFSGIFILFFSFFNYFSTTLAMFFYSLQNSLLVFHDILVERLRMFTESSNSSVLRRVFTLIVSVILVLVAIENMSFTIRPFAIAFEKRPLNDISKAPVLFRNFQHINVVYSRFNC